VLRQRLLHRRLQPRLQDDRRRQAGGGRRYRQGKRAAAAVPLLALRRGQAASAVQQPVPVELSATAEDLTRSEKPENPSAIRRLAGASELVSNWSQAGSRPVATRAFRRNEQPTSKEQGAIP